MRTRLAGIVTLAAWSVTASAQDAPGCKDHALFNRLKGYVVVACESKEFDAYKFPVGKPLPGQDPAYRFEEVEGRRTDLTYNPPEGAAVASSLQILRNFQAAAKTAGGIVMGEYRHEESDTSSIGGGMRVTTIKFVRGTRETWAVVRADEDGAYSLAIVERASMRQDIAASEIADAIRKTGLVALYINFDTGMATIKPDSEKTLDAAAEALKSAPDLRIEVAGHTDNVGKADANRALSEARAQSVMQALVARGIATSRLTARGYGQDRPATDNATEAGRAKNRRVELVRR